MAVAAGLVGCFAVMRRMALAADPLSHVALPGIGVALALHIDPVFGAAAMLFFGALLVWALEEAARATTETVFGVVFSAALALGSLTTSGEDLIEALFGGAGGLSWPEAVFGPPRRYRHLRGIRNSLVVMLVSLTLPAPPASTSAVSTCFTPSVRARHRLGLRYLRAPNGRAINRPRRRRPGEKSNRCCLRGSTVAAR
jgi:hypothetical protein